uniref:Olfactory receptor n=1 Tax=Apolygus lucorum TaxID=248454 RepID=A0A1Q1NIR8_APOLU|nr:olfactory receptor [Apolygus lucorum]
MKSKVFYFTDDAPKSTWDKSTRIYHRLRPVLLVVLLIENAIGLYFLEGFGVMDGSIIYLPICLLLFVINSTAYFSRKAQDRLIATLNKHFTESNEPWMLTVSHKYTTKVWKYIKLILIYDKACKCMYLAAPLICDTVLHYVFDMLEKPFYLPTFITPWLPKDVTWGPHYYLILVFGWWGMLECLNGIMGFMIGYTLLVTYVLIQVVIFKEKVKSAKIDGSQEEVDAEFRTLLSWHVDNLQLNRDLKAYFGFTCAFQSIFLSVGLTLTVFTAVSSKVIAVKIAYGVGFFFYFGTGLLYCSLGQLLENEVQSKHSEKFEYDYATVSHTAHTRLPRSMQNELRKFHADFETVLFIFYLTTISNIVGLKFFLPSSPTFITVGTKVVGTKVVGTKLAS